METVSVKFEESFLRDIEEAMKEHSYMTKTECIREAVRNKLDQFEREAALRQLKKMYGASKRRTTNKERHDAGERAFEDLERNII